MYNQMSSSMLNKNIVFHNNGKVKIFGNMQKSAGVVFLNNTICPQNTHNSSNITNASNVVNTHTNTKTQYHHTTNIAQNLSFIKKKAYVTPLYVIKTDQFNHKQFEYFNKQSQNTMTKITGTAVDNNNKMSSEEQDKTHDDNGNSIVVRNDVFPHNMCLGTGIDGIIKISGVSGDKTGCCIINGKLVYSTPNVPQSSTDDGVTGQIAWDASFVYVCIEPNTWKRSGISNW